MEQGDSGKFYDIHMHSFNLSHPSLSSFLKRFLINDGVGIACKFSFCIIVGLIFLYFLFKSIAATVIVTLLIIVALITVASHAIRPSGFSTWLFNSIVKYFKRPLNLLALMENDIGNFYLVTEKVLMEEKKKGLINDKGLMVLGGHKFKKIVVTPLMMDFGLPERISNQLPYGQVPIHKPIADQVVDVFNGIRTYLEISPYKMFEIYPFLGINTNNYSLKELQALLKKYFQNYARSEKAFEDNLGKFDGNIDKLGVNYFIGIKVYPPLGFDPWPNDKEAREKVALLYSYSQKTGIPITAHCNDGGFVVDSIFKSQDRTSPGKWEAVLKAYPKLKLNLAHMGRQSRISRARTKYQKDTLWTDHVFKLIAEYEHVYTDFSCRGFTDGYYRDLKNLLAKKSVELEEELKDKNYTLEDKIIFGSDFMINLLTIDSYNDYLKIYSDTAHLDDKEKVRYCRDNPRSYLYG